MKLASEETFGTGREVFLRQDLGLPFSSDESRLSEEVLDVRRERCLPAPLRMCVMGIDVGKQLHVVMRGRLSGCWYLLEALTVEDFVEIEGCFDCYCIACCVVDGQPELREARRFQAAHPGAVWVAQYVPHGLDPDWVHRGWLVRAPRRAILDETFDRFREGVNDLPPDARELADGDYYRHLQAPVRVIEPDRWGDGVPFYRSRRPDDLAHAETYATLASMRAELDEGWTGSVGIGLDGHPNMTPSHGSDYAWCSLPHHR